MSCGPESLWLTPPRAERKFATCESDPIRCGLAICMINGQMTRTTKDHPPARCHSDAAAIEPPTGRETQAELVVLTTASEVDLKSRIQHRRAELISTLRRAQSGYAPRRNRRPRPG